MDEISTIHLICKKWELNIIKLENYKIKILVIGTAGFIGFYLWKSHLGKDNIVVGLDNINDFYVNLKYAR